MLINGICHFADCNGIHAGLENGTVKDHQFSASSSWDDWNGGKDLASEARLNNDHFWASGRRVNQWIQIDFLTETPIKGVISQGCGYKHLGQWVTAYQVLFGSDEATLEPIREFGSIKVRMRALIGAFTADLIFLDCACLSYHKLFRIKLVTINKLDFVCILIFV